MSKGDRTWFNYTPLSSVGTEIKDDGTRVFCAIEAERGDGLPPLELAILGDETKLELIRIKTPATDGNLDEEERRIVGSMTEHAITMLRLLFDPDIDRLYLAGNPIALGQFGTHDGLPQMKALAREVPGERRYDAELIRNAIVATAPIRVQLTLFVEASRSTTPLPYRYLCYYKILELELRRNKKWVGLAERLAKYEDDYEKLQIGEASLKTLLHSYRDKCAHIKVGANDEPGLLGRGSKDSERVTKFLPLFNRIVIDLLNEKHADIIALTAAEPTRPIATDSPRMPTVHADLTADMPTTTEMVVERKSKSPARE
jgi:hypothetical protein